MTPDDWHDLAAYLCRAAKPRCCPDPEVREWLYGAAAEALRQAKQCRRDAND